MPSKSSSREKIKKGQKEKIPAKWEGCACTLARETRRHEEDKNRLWEGTAIGKDLPLGGKRGPMTNFKGSLSGRTAMILRIRSREGGTG